MEESAAIARVRVMAMLSTYSDLEDQLSSDDLESEVERGSNFTKKTTPSTAKHCPFIFLLRQARGRAVNGPCFAKYETI